MITRLTFDLTPTLQSHCLWHFSFDSFTFSEDYFCSLRAPHYARLTLIDSIDSSPPPNSFALRIAFPSLSLSFRLAGLGSIPDPFLPLFPVVEAG
ncbi:hypothetical protein Q3G72_027333 [Acer saccharum]|nr:hypothetical protein Q3G72_027333 [Acer saccharum]